MKAFLSLGSNLGDKEANLEKAVGLINDQAGRVIRRSSFYYSEPWGFHSDNNFVNLVILIETDLDPIDLLHTTQSIERMLGRTEKSKDGRYADRIIDIDILLYESVMMQTEELTIPHPLMLERDFVMIPFKEIQENCK